MKKQQRLILGMAFILVCVVIFRCDSQSSLQNEKNEYDKVKMLFTNIGSLHNEGLDYLLENYLEMEEPQTIEELETKTHDLIIEFFDSKEIEICDDVLCSAMEMGKNLSKEERIDIKPVRMNLAKNYNRKFCKKIETFYDRIDNVLISNSFHDNRDSLFSIAYESYQNLGPEESREVIATCSILQYSYEYWLDNAQEWIATLSGITTNSELYTGEKLRKVALDTGYVEYLKSSAKTDAITAGGAIIPCLWTTIGWAPCVVGAGLGGSAVYMLYYIGERYL